MPYGIRIYNDSGIVQIDDEQPNYVLIAQGVIYVPPYSNATAGLATIGFGGQNAPAMVFIRPPYGVPVCGSIMRSTAEVFKNNCPLYNFSTNGVNVEYAVFGNRAERGDENGFGLKVYNGAGQVMFTTNDTPVRIVGALEYPLDGAQRTLWAGGGPGRLFFSVAGTGYWEGSNSGGSSPYVAQCTAGCIQNESQVDLLNRFSRTGPGAFQKSGHRMLMAARIY